MVKGAAIGLSASRVALGVAMGVAPRAVLVPWIGRDGKRPSAAALTRMVAARDVAIGAGALSSLLRGRDARRWMVAQLASDAADLATSGLSPRSAATSGGRRATMAMAATGAVIAAGYLVAAEPAPDA